MTTRRLYLIRVEQKAILTCINFIWMDQKFGPEAKQCHTFFPPFISFKYFELLLPGNLMRPQKNKSSVKKFKKM